MPPRSNPQVERFLQKRNYSKCAENAINDTIKTRHDVTPEVDTTARQEKKRKPFDEKLASETKRLKNGEIGQESEIFPYHMATH